jgi:hypothetical protein
VAVDRAGQQVGISQIDPPRRGPGNRLARPHLDNSPGGCSDLTSEWIVDAVGYAPEDREVYFSHFTLDCRSRPYRRRAL